MSSHLDIENAAKRISNYVNKTPVHTSRTLNSMIGSEIYIKCENFQRIGAFKFRGACNALLSLDEHAKSKGVVTHSSGNHAQAIALAGKELGIRTTIVMPHDAPQVKINATKGYGADVVFSEANIESREEKCNELIEKFGYTLIHPYDNENVIRGAGTASLELIEEVGELDYLIVPIGGGGLMSGSSIYAKGSKKVKIVIGAEPENANDAYRSFITKERITSNEPNTIADGLRTLLSERTYNYIMNNVDDIIPVSEAEIINAMRFLWERMKLVIEPSGAIPLAVLFKMYESGKLNKGSKVGIILSGGNIDLSFFFEEIMNSIPQ